jgi:hypothetical protein
VIARDARSVGENDLRVSKKRRGVKLRRPLDSPRVRIIVPTSIMVLLFFGIGLRANSVGYRRVITSGSSVDKEENASSPVSVNIPR